MKDRQNTAELDESNIHSKIRELLEIYNETETDLTAEECIERIKLELDIEDDEELINFAFIEAGNVINQHAYEYVKQEDRIVLIPHCLLIVSLICTIFGLSLYITIRRETSTNKKLRPPKDATEG